MRVALLAVVSLVACSTSGSPSRTTDDNRQSAPPTCTTIAASGDATISKSDMRTNYGAKKTLLVGDGNDSLLDFDLSSIPAGVTVSDAKLHLYVSDAGDQPVEAHRAKAPWVESTVTFASFANQLGPHVAGLIDLARSNVSKAVDITKLVRHWVAGKVPNDGVVLTGTGHHQTTFVSREGGVAEQRPTLEVCYTAGDFCADDPCQNGGTCDSTPTGFTCTCAAGFTGATCDTRIDACAGDPCENGATCTDAGSGYTCACAAGYTGTSCETNIDDCTPEPCLNGGVCTDGVASFTCTCPAGFTGATCETAIDHCDGAPCQNGGTCTNSPTGYTCACADGFAGASCEVDIDDCAGDPCHNGGTCVDGVAAFSCVCAPDWGGPTCDVNLDTCDQAPCLNGGTCTNGFGTYTCACAPGYTGANCEVDIDDCATNPCENGGVCVDGVASYTCTCPAGFTGASCETNIDDCASAPCLNGGRCTDGVASFTCACAFGFTGTTCEDPKIEIEGTLRAFPNGLPELLGTNLSEYLTFGDYPASSFTASDAALWTDAQAAGSAYKLALVASPDDPSTFVFDSPSFAPTGTTDAFALDLHTAITYVPGTQLVVSAAEPVAVYLNDNGPQARWISHGVVALDTFAQLVGVAPGDQISIDVYYTHATGPGTQLHLEMTRPTCSSAERLGYADVPTTSLLSFGNATVGASPVAYRDEVTSTSSTVSGIRLVPSAGSASTSGAVWASQPIAGGRPFRVEFDAFVSNPNNAEGFAFVMSPTNHTRGGVGPDLGYAGFANIAVEFDYHQDLVYGDPSQAQSIAVHSNGAAPNTASETSGSELGESVPTSISLIDTAVWSHITITYDPSNGSGPGFLRVYLDDGLELREAGPTDPTHAVLVAEIPDVVSAALGDQFYLGFTSSTQASPAVAGEADIVHWRVAQPDCVSCSTVSALSSIVSAPTTVLASHTSSLVVRSADAAGTPFHDGGAAACFASMVVDGSDSQPGTVIDNDDGTYTVTYQPDQPGTWTGFVRAQGADIQGSPFQFTAE